MNPVVIRLVKVNDQKKDIPKNLPSKWIWCVLSKNESTMLYNPIIDFNGIRFFATQAEAMASSVSFDNMGMMIRTLRNKGYHVECIEIPGSVAENLKKLADQHVQKVSNKVQEIYANLTEFGNLMNQDMSGQMASILTSMKESNSGPALTSDMNIVYCEHQPIIDEMSVNDSYDDEEDDDEDYDDDYYENDKI